jgi:cbb3-type cytochrome oxidase subunit 3
MKQFFHDMIHLTEGEKFIRYWWLWLSLLLMGVVIFAYQLKRDKQKRK